MSAKPKAAVSASRAESVSLTDFSEALSTGVLRAIDARKIEIKKPELMPWIWAGWWIGNGPWRGQGGPDIPTDEQIG